MTRLSNEYPHPPGLTKRHSTSKESPRPTTQQRSQHPSNHPSPTNPSSSSSSSSSSPSQSSISADRREPPSQSSTRPHSRQLSAKCSSTPSALPSGRSSRGSHFLWTATLIALIFLSAVLYAFLNLQRDTKLCRMSYMYPTYVKQAGFDLEHTRLANRYSLYLYREYGLDSTDNLIGVPVLFVPGNAGSYKQIRPLAAESANQFDALLKSDGIDSLHTRGTKPLDFFTVDFDEDFSAFHGQTLLDQAEYLNAAVAYILSLYTTGDPDNPLPDPTSVIIIGHSMGGIAARLMQTMPNYLQKSVNTIITMSTPHALPPAPFDSKMEQIYTELNAWWTDVFRNTSLHNLHSDMAILSIAGGGLDTIVSSDYTSLEFIVPPKHGFTVFTSAIPQVWTCADHQAILWCDQLRKVMARTLLSIIDTRRPSQTKALSNRMAVLRNALTLSLDRTTDDTERIVLDKPIAIQLKDSAADDAELVTLAYRPELTEQTAIIRLTGRRSLEVLADDMSVFEVMLCTAMHSSGHEPVELVCNSAYRQFDLLPSQMDLTNTGSEVRVSVLRLTAAQTQDASHIVIKAHLPDQASFLRATAATHDFVAPRRQFFTTSVFSHAFRTARYDLDRSGISSRVRIADLTNSLLAYHARVLLEACPAQQFVPILRQRVVPAGEAKYHRIEPADAKIEINFHGYAPYFPLTESDGGVEFELWRDPACATAKIQLELRLDPLGSLGMLVMRYRVALVGFLFISALLAYERIFRTFRLSGEMPTYQQALIQVSTHYVPPMLVTLGIASFGFSWLNERRAADLAVRDVFVSKWKTQQFLLGLSQTQLWWLAPLFFLVALGVLHVFSLALQTLVWFVARLLLFIPSNSNASASPPMRDSSNARRRVIVTGALLLIVATIVPYQFAFVVACMAQLLTCIRTELARQRLAIRFCRKPIGLSTTPPLPEKANRPGETGSSEPSSNKVPARSDSPAATLPTPAQATDPTKLDHQLPLRRAEQLARYNLGIVICMLIVLPIDVPVLLVWLRNISSNLFVPFTDHHNVLVVAPVILLVEQLAAGALPYGHHPSSLPRRQVGKTVVVRRLVNVVAFGVSATITYGVVVSSLFGVMHAYLLHPAFNLLAASLFLYHLLSATSLSTTTTYTAPTPL
ncbi:GPI inositol deacylase [Savitreella phatthalungensis]